MEKNKESILEYFESIYEIASADKKAEIDNKKRLIQNAQENGFNLIELSVKNGYGPLYHNAVKDEVIAKFDEFLYNTTRNGPCYLNRHFILAKDTGVKDRHQRPIFQTYGGNTYVKEFTPGSPAHFAGLEICDPDL